MGGREVKGEKRRELKMGRGREKGKCVLTFISICSICSVEMNLNVIWTSCCAIWEDILSAFIRKDGAALKWHLYHLVLSRTAYLKSLFFVLVCFCLMLVNWRGSNLRLFLTNRCMSASAFPSHPAIPARSIYRTARRPCHRGRGK